MYSAILNWIVGVHIHKRVAIVTRPANQNPESGRICRGVCLKRDLMNIQRASLTTSSGITHIRGETIHLSRCTAIRTSLFDSRSLWCKFGSVYFLLRKNVIKTLEKWQKGMKNWEIELPKQNIKLNQLFWSICNLKIAFYCVKFAVLFEIYL